MSNHVAISADDGVCRDTYVRPASFEEMACKFLTDHLVKYLMDLPAYRNLVADQKINWIPGSKGGEPNCRRE